MTKQQFLEDASSSFQVYIYEDNQKIVPTSPVITINKPGGSEELISAQPMSTGADGILSYDLTADNNDVADLNYKAVVTYTHGGITSDLTLYYDVVRSKLLKVITDDDINEELPQLKLNGWRVNGTAESGTATTIVDSNLAVYEDDYFTGGAAYSIDRDETRLITNFTQSSGAVTTEAFSGAISTDKYVITQPYTKPIQRAFDKLETKLNQMGRRAHLILDPYDLREVHILMSVAEIVKGLAIEEESLWYVLWGDYNKQAEKAFKALNFKYDTSEDGYISGSEETDRFRTLTAERR